LQKSSTHGGTAFMSSNHVLTYTPALNYIGFDTLFYQICDSASAAFINPYICDTAIIFITIGPNVVDDNYLVKCNDSLYFNPILNDNYGNGNYPITVTMLDSADNGVVIWNNNTVKYIPNPGFTGIDSIEYQICVNNICSSAKIYLHVSCAVLPIAVDDYITVKNNETSTIYMLNNDTTNGVVSIQVITNPANGTYVIDATNHTIIYTPATNYHGNDKIQYVICNEIGCDTAWIYIAIDDNSPCQFSTGFSPNNDGVNDFYTVNCAYHYAASRLTIFNRWGNIIYSRKGNSDASNSWDGKYNGVEIPDGTYYYIFEVTENDKNPKTGFIELKR
jgi:gliding motility-associated-like protein